MDSASEIYYYEQHMGEFYLYVDGVPVVCRSFSEMASYVENPQTAEFTEVGQHNWQSLYDSGVFHD